MREPSQSEHVRKPWKQLIDVHENLEREKTLRGRVLVVTAVRKGTSKNIKVFIRFRFTEFEKMLPFYKNVTYLFSFTDRDKATNRSKCEYVWKCEVVVLEFMLESAAEQHGLILWIWVVMFFLVGSHFPNVIISLVSRSLCWKFLKKMITEDAILNFISTRVSETGFSASWFTPVSI